MSPYVAFLRGINVGGNKKVPMADLKKLLEKAGFGNVQTLLASGNVRFDSAEKNLPKLTAQLEVLIEKKFTFPVPVILRTVAELQSLSKSNPFKGIVVDENTRLYVTFLSAKPTSTMKIPYTSPDGSFRILKVLNGEVISVAQITPNAGTVEAMGILEKEFGKKVTTRNWNTVQKLLQ